MGTIWYRIKLVNWAESKSYHDRLDDITKHCIAIQTNQYNIAGQSWWFTPLTCNSQPSSDRPSLMQQQTDWNPVSLEYQLILFDENGLRCSYANHKKNKWVEVGSFFFKSQEKSLESLSHQVESQRLNLSPSSVWRRAGWLKIRTAPLAAIKIKEHSSPLATEH